MEERYLIIADDFTGANDTGVQLRRRGFPTEVLFCGKPMGADRSIVIDTESRTVHPDHAYEIVSHALEDVDFDSFRYVIKKVDSTMRGNIPTIPAITNAPRVDSTMRGNIAAEIKAVDEHFKPELMIFAPALPDLKRTTIDGVQCLNGVEICRTELASDPKNPVVEDDLVRMLERYYEEKVILKRLPDVRSDDLDFTEGRIYVCDADCNDDLKKVLKAVAKTGKKVLYIGTAGLADNLMELERPSLPALGVVASVSTVTNRQMKYCEEAGIKMVKLPMHDILSGKEDTECYLKEVVDSLKAGKDTILLTNTAYDRSELELSFEAGEALGLGPVETGDKVRSIVGRLAMEILEQVKVSGVFLTGGDTALGMLMNIEADGSQILSEIRVGIPLVQVKGGKYEGMKLVTKAGAFGADDAAAFALRKIKEA